MSYDLQCGDVHSYVDQMPISYYILSFLHTARGTPFGRSAMTSEMRQHQPLNHIRKRYSYVSKISALTCPAHTHSLSGSNSPSLSSSSGDSDEIQTATENINVEMVSSLCVSAELAQVAWSLGSPKPETT